MGEQVRVTVEARLLDRARAAAALSISTDTLDKLRKRGCPCIAVPGTAKVLYDLEDAVAWLKEQSKPSETLTEKEAGEKLDSLLRN